VKVHWCSASCACIYIGYYCCWYAYMDRPFGGRPPTRYRKVLWTCDKSEPARSAILRPTLTQFRHFAALMSNHKVSLAYELLLMRWVIKLSTPAITPAFLYSFIFHRCYFFTVSHFHSRIFSRPYRVQIQVILSAIYSRTPNFALKGYRNLPNWKFGQICRYRLRSEWATYILYIGLPINVKFDMVEYT